MRDGERQVLGNFFSMGNAEVWENPIKKCPLSAHILNLLRDRKQTVKDQNISFITDRTTEADGFQ